ncbi:MAG: hypothetical protein M3O50_08020 [Myxococcota bacterium]|nr:hypothetical protein [Myxococcota bacterium]
MSNNGALIASSPSRAPLTGATAASDTTLASLGGAGLCEVKFVSEALAGQDVAMTFVAPFACAAILQPADFQTLGVETSAPASIDGLLVCFTPSGAATSLEEQRRVDQWIETSPAPGRPVIDLLIRGDRIRWRPGRCVIQGAADRFRELLQAVTSFAFYEARLRKLEADLEAVWPTAERDIVLTRRLTGRSLERWQHVDNMTEEMGRRRLEFARLEPHLEKPPLSLSAVSQRAIAELTVQADVEDRLVYVDDRLEVFEELYQRTNERLCEYSYFRRENAMELGIVVAIVLQVAVEIVFLMK